MVLEVNVRGEIMETKECVKCGEIRSLDEFQLRKDTGKLRGVCKICRAEQEASRRATPGFKPKPITKEAKDKYNFNLRARRYGLSVDDLLELLKEADGICKICGEEADLVVDHNHETGEVRGVICGPCNLMLGHARDNISILSNGIKYLLGEG